MLNAKMFSLVLGFFLVFSLIVFASAQTATVTISPSNPGTSNGYKIIPLRGVNDFWVQIYLQDSFGSDGNYIQVNEGETADFSYVGFKVKVIDVRAQPDRTVTEVDIEIISTPTPTPTPTPTTTPIATPTPTTPTPSPGASPSPSPSPSPSTSPGGGSGGDGGCCGGSGLGGGSISFPSDYVYTGAKPASILASTTVKVTGDLPANNATDFDIAGDVGNKWGIKRVTVNTSQIVFASDATIEIRIFDLLPKEDDYKQKLDELPLNSKLLKAVQIKLPQAFKSKLRSAKINFVLNREELNLTDPLSVGLLRFANKKWDELETSAKNLGNGSYEYTAITPGFSVFAVAGLEGKQISLTGAGNTSIQNQTSSNITGLGNLTSGSQNLSSASPATGFLTGGQAPIIAVIIIVLIIIGYFFIRKRKSSADMWEEPVNKPEPQISKKKKAEEKIQDENDEDEKPSGDLYGT